jgi:hypothetical protein
VDPRASDPVQGPSLWVGRDAGAARPSWTSWESLAVVGETLQLVGLQQASVHLVHLSHHQHLCLCHPRGRATLQVSSLQTVSLPLLRTSALGVAAASVLQGLC